jgi:hypothetical protein
MPSTADVIVHYRCGDFVPSDEYGFLPFEAIIKLIPNNSTSIYILTDPPNRAAILSPSSRFSGNCKGIVVELFKMITARFPSAVVFVKNGGDPIEDYIRIMKAEVVICSASTFCLWPGLANQGKVFFPLTGLIGGWKTGMNAADMPRLGESFYWIVNPLIITSFTKDSTLNHILSVLKKRVLEVTVL